MFKRKQKERNCHCHKIGKMPSVTMSWTAAQPSNHHHFPRTHIQDEKGSSNCCHMPWASSPSHQKREAENVNSNVEVGSLGKHREQLRREGELGALGCLSTTNHLLSHLPSPQAFPSTLQQEKLEAALMEAPPHSCVCVLSTGWAQQREGKNHSNPTKICFQHFSCNPYNCRTSS